MATEAPPYGSEHASTYLKLNLDIYIWCTFMSHVYLNSCFAEPSSSKYMTTEAGTIKILCSKKLKHCNNKSEWYWISCVSLIVLPGQ